MPSAANHQGIVKKFTLSGEWSPCSPFSEGWLSAWYVILCVCDVLAVSKAFKTLENEEGYKRCQEIVDEAKIRVDEAVSWLSRFY